MRTKLTIKHPRPASPSRAPVRSGSLVARKPTRPAAPPDGAPKPKSKPSAKGAAPREADRPSRSEARPARDGERPFRSEGRPARDGERPARNGARPPRDGERPFRSEGRPARDGERPVRSGARPPRDGERPFRSEGRPARDGERPVRSGARPPRDGERPFRSEGRPARDGERPFRSEGRPARDGERPVRSGARPPRDGERPFRSEGRPARDGERPVRSGARPPRDGERPVRAGTRPPRDGDRPSRVESRPARDTDRPARKPRVTTERPAPSRLKVAQPVKARPSFDSGDEAGMMRLSKRMSELGLCSRREADEWIEKGWVLVDGERIDTLGTKVRPDQKIEIDDQAIAAQAAQVTILLHKPVGYVSGQAEDGYEPAVTLITRENHWSGDRSALRLSPLHLRTLAPAGRLDIDSTGLLVLTQDGRIAKQLIGEQSDIDKEYLVRVRFGEHVIDVDQHFPAESLAKLRHGLELDGVPLKPAMVSWQNSEQLRFVLREGKKRQIRRMCELVGLEVVGLKRVRMGRVMLGALPQGQWRYLGADETF
ncbi:pseudouridine synthase [Burkholderia glumae]|uniref:pseudouridine synthase n=1 Tax=Burkholderia glumae TaxID=337 RepID=UPI0013741368|nr:pseudouridine synthase [Burkholderia glumae]MCQ0030268.1 pseudouridine synthase [Burkholderia glumae]MCQ0036599.1 pseudouridine synthase [Burkholderia glumae]MCR1765650.1 pseudouridine synthase [Burkholderia glumae]QHP90232.1 pseudouridine synthase [Burkholderia glumae]QJW77968.1 pseudouridine synthase [Burkholderia glumae]